MRIYVLSTSNAFLDQKIEYFSCNRINPKMIMFVRKPWLTFVLFNMVSIVYLCCHIIARRVFGFCWFVLISVLVLQRLRMIQIKTWNTWRRLPNRYNLPCYLVVMTSMCHCPTGSRKPYLVTLLPSTVFLHQCASIGHLRFKVFSTRYWIQCTAFYGPPSYLVKGYSRQVV